MALSYSPSKAVYIGNGVTVDFPFDFKVWKDTNLEVSIISPQGVVEVVTGWTAKITDRGGTITYRKDGAPLPTGWKLAVLRDMPFEQDVDLVSGTRFDPQVVEDQMDKAAAERQQLREAVGRAIAIPTGYTETPQELLNRIFEARETAVVSAGEAAKSAVEAADIADDAASSGNFAQEQATQAEYWALRSENASNTGPATPDKIGSVKPGEGLSVRDSGLLDVNAGRGLTIKGTDNCLEVDASTVATGVLPMQHGGTGADSAKGACDNLGISAWQNAMEASNPQRMRNVVLQGREKDGYPAYLVGQDFIDMQHEDGVYHSRRGTVSVSGEYGATYRGTKPLRNQVVYQSSGWLTPSTVKAGWWQYDFADGPHVLTGLFMQSGHTDNYPTASIKTWQLLGWDDNTAQWEKIYSRDADQQHRGYANNLKSHGRMYWFTENTKAYTRIRINIDDNWGGAYSNIGAIRFYEAVIPDMHKYDVALYATPEKPFAASIACGLADAATGRTLDKAVRLTAPVVFDGAMLAEMSRNYMYIVPANAGGTLPANLDATRAVALPEQGAYLYTDTRKIHYGTQRDVANGCFGLLQSRHSVAYNPVPEGEFEHSMGAWEYPLYFYNTRVDVVEKPRGANSSYLFSGASTNYIGPNKNLATSGFPKSIGHPYSNEMTMEVDFTWAGPAPAASDTYHVLYDNGYHTSRGWALAYHGRKKCLALHWGSPTSSGFIYAVPFNAADGQWHTVSISQRGSNLFIHVDGVCLGAFDDVPLCNPNYRYWMLGRWIHANSSQWYGHVNNLRVTLGTCLYQGGDYSVSPVFYRSLIPHKTLWYDAAQGVVKEWQADTETWLPTPMLPVGHVDTGRREHLLSDQPRGTYHLQQTKYVLGDGYATDGVYDSSHVPASLFNFGSGGQYPYASIGPASAEHYASFSLESPMAFDRMALCNTTWDWRAFPAKFIFAGSNDGGISWVTLVDRSTFVDDGGQLDAQVKTNGDTHNVGLYKTFWYNNPQEFALYRLTILPKTDVPFYADYAHTATRIMLTLRGGKPEVKALSSYVLGDVFTIGPVRVGLSTELEIALPFANVAFDATGFVEEENDYQVKRRVLGQQGYNYSEGNNNSGEIVYVKSDAIVVQTGSHYLTPYIGKWNTMANHSAVADIYIVAKKRY